MTASMWAQTSPAAETGIEGTIMISPTHGGPTRVGVSNSRPLAGTDFAVQNEKGDEVTSFKTDDQGHFRVVLGPGHYKVLRKAGQRIGFFGPFEAEVTAGQVTKVQWQCDSGMR
jgi:hypothetical protein